MVAMPQHRNRNGHQSRQNQRSNGAPRDPRVPPRPREPGLALLLATLRQNNAEHIAAEQRVPALQVSVPRRPVFGGLIRCVELVVRPLPALLAACAAALVVFVPVGSTAVVAGDCTPGALFRPANAAFADGVIRLVNQHRATIGLRALKISQSLTASAVWKARHMATYGYIGHDDPAPPVARSAADRIAACGYRGGWGENIAAGFTTPAAVLAAWLQSPGHRANIENPAYVVTGAGASVSANGVTVWAQDFGLTDDSGSTGPAKSPTPTAQNKIILRKLHVTQRAGRLVLHVRALLAPSMQPLRRGSTGCGASAGDRKLHVIVRRFSQGAVTCVWRIPAASRPIKATVFVSTRTARPAHATVAVIPR